MCYFEQEFKSWLEKIKEFEKEKKKRKNKKKNSRELKFGELEGGQRACVCVNLDVGTRLSL